MKARLTNTYVNKLKPEATRYEVWDTQNKGLYIRVSPTGQKTWYIHFRIDGKKGKFRIGNGLTATQAEVIYKEKMGSVAKGDNIQKQRVAKRKQNKAHTLKTFIECNYAEWCRANRKRPEDTLKRIQKHFYPLFGSTLLKDITAWNIEKWKIARLKAGIKPTTINKDMAELKCALSKAVEWGEISEHPLKNVKPAKIDKSPNVRYLTKDEENRLRNALEVRDKRIKVERASANSHRAERGYPLYPDLFSQAYTDHLTPMVLLSINTGLRRGEIFHLNWKDINLNTNVLTVQGVKAKSGNTRQIPLNKEAQAILVNWKPKESGLVFPNKDGNPLDNIKKSWSTLLNEANIINFRWHDLRHHFASRLVMAGVDLNTVRELLGHSNIKTTLIYAHLSPEHKAEAVQLLCK